MVSSALLASLSLLFARSLFSFSSLPLPVIPRALSSPFLSALLRLIALLRFLALALGGVWLEAICGRGGGGINIFIDFNVFGFSTLFVRPFAFTTLFAFVRSFVR